MNRLLFLAHSGANVRLFADIRFCGEQPRLVSAWRETYSFNGPDEYLLRDSASILSKKSMGKDWGKRLLDVGRWSHTYREMKRIMRQLEPRSDDLTHLLDDPGLMEKLCVYQQILKCVRKGDLVLVLIETPPSD